MKNSLEKEYRKHAKKFVTYLKKCRKKLTKGDIHQLRVSVKRMQAIFELAQFINGSSRSFKNDFPDVRQLFKVAGVLRENQLNRKLAKRQKNKSLKPYTGELNSLHPQHKGNLIHELDNFNIKRCWKETSQFLESAHPIKGKKLMEETVLYIRHKESLIRQVMENQEGAEGYHEIRKYLKQIGIILPFLKNQKGNEYGKEYLPRFMEAETLIGQWHDIEVLKRSLQTYNGPASDNERERDLDEAISQLADKNRERIELIQERLYKLIPA